MTPTDKDLKGQRVRTADEIGKPRQWVAQETGS